MAELPRSAAQEPITAGFAHLAEADWLAARESFSEALAGEETPEALEGLSWAAWWLDDADVVFDARERAYHGYREQGDPVGAARMAIWLGCDQLDFRGATSVAGGWLRRAGRLLEAVELQPEHGWLAFHEGYLANLIGDPATAARLADRASEIGRRFDIPDLVMLGLAMRGSILVGCAEVEAGMRCLDEAKVMAGEATLPISGAWACCFLVSACTAVLDFERAFQWCDSISRFADQYGSRYILAFCRAEYGAVHLWRGEWSDAEQMLESSVADFSSSRPAMEGGPLVALAELRRRQGRRDEAVHLLDRAGSSAPAMLCRARLELDRGNPRRSVELIERALRQSPEDRKLDRAPAFELLARCHAARGDLEQAQAALESLREVDKLVSTEPVRALTDLTEGILKAAAGHHEEARTRLEDAVDRFQRCRAPYETATARIELAVSLGALGRLELAEQEATRALETLERLDAAPEAARAQRVRAIAAHNGQAPGGPSPVTTRERDVLVLLAEGLTNRQIADRLVVSEHTVHRHITNILRKLDQPSRTAAAAYAVRSGLLEPDREWPDLATRGAARRK